MLMYHLDYIFKCFVLVFALIAAIIIYAYYANMRRADDDPKKREYHPMAILLAPITVPFFLILSLMAFLFTALMYAGFIVFFAIMLVAIRKPFLFKWWDKFATSIGDPLLRISTSLIGLVGRPFKTRAQSMPEKSPTGYL